MTDPLWQCLPPELVRHVLSYDGTIKYRRGKYINQLSPERYTVLYTIPPMTMEIHGNVVHFSNRACWMSKLFVYDFPVWTLEPVLIRWCSWVEGYTYYYRDSTHYIFYKENRFIVYIKNTIRTLRRWLKIE